MQAPPQKEFEPSALDLEEAQALIDAGYRQTSRKYRLVARLPEGMNGREAMRWALFQYAEHYDKRPLKQLCERDIEWIARMSDNDAGNFFRSVYASYPCIGLSKALTVGQFIAFRKLGGQSA